MSQLTHPNLTKFHKAGKLNDMPYLVMDLVEGMNLEQFPVTQGVPPVETYIDIALKLAEALNAIHSENIIHRDIKLQNIMVNLKKGEVKLTDFGVARKIKNYMHITKTGFL